MIQAHAVYKHKHAGDYVRTGFLIYGEMIECRPLTRDLNCQSGYCPEVGQPVLCIPRTVFERDWQFLKELR